ncbi:MAG: Coq4 family protein [Pseudomonadota bacterium]
MPASNRKKKRIQPIVALRALRRLIADPEQTEEVFNVIDALSGPSLENGLVRFKSLPVGQRILRENVVLLDTLRDRGYLSTLPKNSLGAHYLDFVIRENLTADGLVEASETVGYDDTDKELNLFGNRQRDMHDLWHTVTQYGRDTLGEACLLAFTYAQTRNRGLGVICLAGCLELRQNYGMEVFKAAWRGYQDGKRAAWLPGQDWEHLLTLPIDEVRTQLGIVAPAQYTTLFHAHPLPA